NQNKHQHTAFHVSSSLNKQNKNGGGSAKQGPQPYELHSVWSQDVPSVNVTLTAHTSSLITNRPSSLRHHHRSIKPPSSPPVHQASVITTGPSSLRHHHRSTKPPSSPTKLPSSPQ
ncbi:hypothetical protein Hamer_G022687, partial [Homarus americanus]